MFNQQLGLKGALFLFFAFCLSLPVFAQESRLASGGGPVIIKDASLDVAPGVIPVAFDPAPIPDALWDVQFNYSATDSVPSHVGGMAGVVYIGTEFWLSKWGSDTLYRMDATGRWLSTVTIAGLSGVRGMTWDGTYIYASNNSPTITKINPVTKTAVGTITTPIPQVRMIAYSPLLASGAGGLYIGNFNTDITAINLSGTTLSTISATTHTLTGMYGCAFDPYSSGGPYLWVFAQSGAPTNVMFHQLQLPSGTPTGLVHDASVDIGSGVTGGLAGGMFLTEGIVPGKKTIGGLMQGAPNRLFGYDLTDPPALDGALDGFRSVPGYTRIPLRQVVPFSFEGTLFNTGSDVLTDPRLVVQVMEGPFTVWSDTVAAGPLGSGADVLLTTSSFTPSGLGNYSAIGYLITVGQTDGFPLNDTMRFRFDVTDSTYARDNNMPTGTGYSVTGSGQWAYATVLWDVFAPDTLTGVWASFDGPVDGDTTYAVIANTFLGEPTTVIATGIPVIISGSGFDYVLRFAEPVILPVGQYSIGLYESFDSTLNLNQSNSYFTTGMNHYYTPVDGWVPSNIATARFIRPQLGRDFVVSAEQPLATSVMIYPNPSTGQVSVGLSLPAGAAVEVSVLNVWGEVILVRDLGNVRFTAANLDLHNQANGVYFVRIKAGEETITRKLVLTR
jgi:hypothetical protein